VSELVDLAALRPDGTAPTPRELRAALPRGWVLCEDGASARRDLRLFFREGWILVTGLVVFGLFGLAFFADVLPRGGRGLARFAVLVGLVALVAGLVAPRITRALYRR
jgi:hypothetical protein